MGVELFESIIQVEPLCLSVLQNYQSDAAMWHMSAQLITRPVQHSTFCSHIADRFDEHLNTVVQNFKFKKSRKVKARDRS